MANSIFIFDPDEICQVGLLPPERGVFGHLKVAVH